MPRERQFGDLRSSRESRRTQLNQSSVSQKIAHTPKRQFDRSSQASSSQSFYVCVNCENLNMSAQKVKDSRQRRDLQRSRYEELQKSRRVFDLHVRESQEKKNEIEKQRILDENRKMIEAHDLAKQRQRNTIQQEQQAQRQRQRQNAMIYEEQMANREKRVKELRNSLERQIQEKNQKNLRQQMEDRYQQPIDNSEEERHLQLQRQKINHFKEGLIQQIKENQAKKRQNKLNERENGTTTFALIKLAEERAKQMLAQEKKTRAKYQEQIRDLTRSTQKKKKAVLDQKQQEKIQAMRDRQLAEQQYVEHQRVRNDRLNKYKNDIKKQIDQKERQKLQDKLQGNYATSYQNLTYQQIQRKLCDSCEKEYPKRYMTKYRRKKR